MSAGRAGVSRRARQTRPKRHRARHLRCTRLIGAMASARWAAARRSISPRASRCWQAIGTARNLRRDLRRHLQNHRRRGACDRDTHDRRTGAEVGRAALITLDDGRKLGFISPHLIPRRAVCDPELTLGLPPLLTAATGLDALSHCLETFLSPRFNPPAEAIALDGAGRIWRNIDAACANRSDVPARTEMMMGALEGGLTFQKGLGAVHALSHALGGLNSRASSRHAQRDPPSARPALQRGSRRRQDRAP